MQELRVNGQTLTVAHRGAIAEGQAGFATFRFEFSSDWDGLDKVALFVQNKKTYQMHLGTKSPATCKMPSEIKSGKLWLSVLGYSSDETVIASTNTVFMLVERCLPTCAGKLDPTPTLYQQWLEELEKQYADIVAQLEARTITVETETDEETGDVLIIFHTYSEDVEATIEHALSAYELAVQQGYDGTLDEWLDSLKGEKGDTGEQGEKGDTGDAGQDGADGETPTITTEDIEGGTRITFTTAAQTVTADVLNGTDGKDGEDGKDGADGKDGEDGADGKDGEDGQDGVSVTSVEQTVTSTDSGGENVVTVTLSDGATSTFSVYNGAQGEKGDAGEQGEPGQDGIDGQDGADGVSPTVSMVEQDDGVLITITDADGEHSALVAKGEKGDTGEQGEQGEQGEKGDKGDPGDDATVSVYQVLTEGTEIARITSGETTTSIYAPEQDEIQAISNEEIDEIFGD